MHFLMTIDVECFSIPLNRCDNDTGREVYEAGLPRLLGLLARHDVQGTFYFTGKMAEMFPEAIELVMGYGHEIGYHGYDHSSYADLNAFTGLLSDRLKRRVSIDDTLENLLSRAHTHRNKPSDFAGEHDFW